MGFSPENESDVFVVGTTFCGSTLLGTALNQHPEVLHAGELAYLPAYHRELFQAETTWPPHCLACGLGGVLCPTWTPEVLRQCQEAGAGAVHDGIRAWSGTRVVVDGSKFPAWLKLCLLRRAGKPLPKVIVAVRNPYAYITSEKRYHRLPALHAAKLWRDIYWETLCTCAALNLDHLIVRHEDFMLRRKATLLRICAFLGLAPVPAMWADDYSENRCSIGGNPGVGAVGRRPEVRRVEGDLPIQALHYSRPGHGVLDVAWKETLSAGEIADALYASALADTAALLGYNLAALAAEHAAHRTEAWL